MMRRHCPTYDRLAVTLASTLLSLVVGGCSNDFQPATVCGAGTVLQGGKCVAESRLRCGAGTYEVGNQCMPFDPNDDHPPVTTYDPSESVVRFDSINVRLVTEPGSRIFYTIDGSEPSPASANEAENVLVPRVLLSDGPVTFKFYAQDGIGNKERVQSVIFEQDLEGPAAVTDFTATTEGNGSVTLRWTNPSDTDFAGVAIFRKDRPIRYEDGVATSETSVAYLGSASTFSDSSNESYTAYVAVAYDVLNNYGEISRTSNLPVTVGSNGWTLRSDGSVSSGTAGSGVDLVITRVLGTTFNVAATNNTSATFHAPKILFKNLVDATLGDGSVGGQRYVRVGSNGVSLAPGAELSANFDVSFTGTADANGVFRATADLGFRHDSLIVAGSEGSTEPLMFVDEATFSQIGTMSYDSYSDNSDGSGMPGLVTKLGSRFLWAGNRNQGKVRKIDSATWSTVAVASVGGSFNYVSTPAWGPNGLLWVPLSTRGPAKRGSDNEGAGSRIGNFVLGIDPDTMVEMRRIAVSATRSLREAKFIPGTAKLVVANMDGGELYVVDVTMGENTPVQTIRDIDIVAGHTLAITLDGKFAILAGNAQGSDERDVSVVELSSGNVTRLGGVASSYVQASDVDHLGRAWLASEVGGLLVLDPRGTREPHLERSILAQSLLIAQGFVYASDGDVLSEYDLGLSKLRETTLGRSVDGHVLEILE